MSFTQDITQELYEFSAGKSCCHKAQLCGLLFGAQKSETDKSYSAFFYREKDAQLAAELIDSRFSAGEKTVIEKASRGGHSGYRICFFSKSIAGVLGDVDSGRKTTAHEAVGFRCAECEGHFIRGVFMSCATVSRPKSGYNLEFAFINEKRADVVADLLLNGVCPPSRRTLGKRTLLYYKSNVKISDLLYFCGAPNASFEVANLAIKRDIRNEANRMTNFETSNMLRTVEAKKRYIDAIRYLADHDKLSLLGDELEYTANLRVEYDDASLSALAKLHIPPISKSGLNARLSKILAIADEVKAQTEK